MGLNVSEQDRLKIQLQLQVQQQLQQSHVSSHSNRHHYRHHQHSLPLEDTTNRNILRIKREKRKQLRLREYQNLCKIIPSLNGLNEVPKVKIINEAVKYIDELHQRLINKLMKSSSPVTPQSPPTTVLLTPPASPLPTSQLSTSESTTST